MQTWLHGVIVSFALASGIEYVSAQVVASSDGEKSGAARASDRQFEESVRALTEADRRLTIPPGGVLFVGSSSIRLWNDLEVQFRAMPVIIKRGFGGARMSDCARYLDRIVIPYKPRLVLVYAGDNDLAEGKSPQSILSNLEQFVHGVHEELPDTRIGYISIKPSPARAALITRMRETNDLIRRYVHSTGNVEFIDVFHSMLDPQGQPRRELFRPDGLHLNESGYALWKSIITPHVR